MTEEEKKNLLSINKEYLSIGITEGGESYNAISVPWERTGNAYNMRTPDVYLAPEDLEDSEIMELISKFKISGCYIWTPLRDYSFLSSFKYMFDLNIKWADNMKNLDFLKEMYHCYMLFLHNAHLENIDVILDVKKSGKTVFGAFECVGLCNCYIDDVSRFEKEHVRFNEFLVWNDEDRNERARWDCIDASFKKYYDMKKN